MTFIYVIVSNLYTITNKVFTKKKKKDVFLLRVSKVNIMYIKTQK